MLLGVDHDSDGQTDRRTDGQLGTGFFAANAAFNYAARPKMALNE